MEENQSINEEEYIMEWFLKDCQEKTYINEVEIRTRTKELLNSRISPTNIREQFDNIILEIYTLGQLSTDQIEQELKKKI